jgi:GAF domain-containing protein
MEREAKSAKAGAGAKTSAPKKPRPRAATDARSAEQRLADAVAQQAATSAILRVMAESPNDVQPVMDAVAEQAARLCHAPFARILLAEGDRMRPLAAYTADGKSTIPVETVPLQRTAISGRAVLDRATVHHADVVPLLDTEYPDARANATTTGFRAVIAVPLMHKGEAYGAIFLWRRESGLFAPDQVALVETFATQAAIAIANVRLYQEAQAGARDLAESLRQQTATNEVLKAISRSTFDLGTVLRTLVASAARLCDADNGTITRQRDGRFYRAEVYGFSREFTDFVRDMPVEPERGSATGRALLEGRVVHIPDVRADPEYTFTEAQKLGDFRTILGVPIMREGRAIGVLALTRTEARPFTDKQIELVSSFADQAAIAIENVRLFTELEARNRDLTEALEQRTATSEILRVISRSPTDVQPIFDAIVESAVRLCDAVYSAAVRLEDGLIHLVAHHNWSDEGLAIAHQLFPMPPEQDHLAAHAIRESRIIHLHNLQGDPNVPDSSRALAVAQGYETLLIVPMLREERAIGAIVVANAEAPFSDKHVALLQTFADQAVIAIENVRLFKELEVRNRDLTEALEQQTATSDILRVISQSQTDVQPVFDTIAAAALKLCRSSAANVFTFDGSLIHLAAVVSRNSAYVEVLDQYYPRPLNRDMAVTRAILARGVCAIPDVFEDPEYLIGDHAAAAGFRSVLAVPLVRDGNAIGGIAVGRAEPGQFPDTQIALLQTFADQAVIAIENVRLFKELEARTTDLTRSVGELKALGEVGQAVSSTLDLETVLSTIVTRATQLAGMDGGSIYEYDEDREEFYLHTADKLPDDLVAALRATPIRKGEGALGRMAMTGEPVQIRDIMDEGSYQSRVREKLMRLGLRALLVVPLLREDHLLGGLAVNRKRPGEFDTDTIALLKTFATQSALAIQNARLFREIEVKSRQLGIASQHKSEFLANMSHELRTPLNAIIGFSEVLSERLFGELNDKQAEYAGDITESGRHLLSLINDILDLSKIEAGRMELDVSEFDPAVAIDNTLSLVRERAQRRAIALRCTVDEHLTTLVADERKVKQVLLNLLSNALKFTPEGGSVDVRATAHDDRVEIAVTDTGVGIAPEDQESVFEEFRQVGAAAKNIEGTGLGLAISRKFIELHGGRIWVTSEPGVGSTFAFTLPRR